LQFIARVPHEQFVMNQEYIRLHATEAVLQRIQQRPFTPIVVMRMRIRNRLNGAKDSAGNQRKTRSYQQTHEP
jgi:hypothetical protein